MSGDAQTTPPSVLWAQRSSVILLTICLEDCKKPEIKIQNDSVYFKGIGGTDKKEHEVTIHLYREIDPEKSLHCVRDRIIEFVLVKKEEGPFWPHLTKERVKHHWLKVDFNKWEDEDDSDGDGDDKMEYLDEMMKKMSGAAGDTNTNFGDISESDSDDEAIPPLD